MNKSKLFLLFSLFIFSSNTYIQAKVLVMTYHYNRPDFIELQYKTFKKFLQDDYELVVFNDAKDPRLEQEIKQICDKYNILCKRISPEIHNRPYLYRGTGEGYNDSCVRCANVVQYSLDTIGFNHDGIVVIFDGDMFLIRPISFEKYIAGYDFGGLLQNRNNGMSNIDYIWNGIVLLNMNNLPEKRTINFNCGNVNGVGCDVGGYTYYYFKEHPKVKLKKFEVIHNQYLICDSCKNAKQYKCIHNRTELERLGFNKNEQDFLQAGPANIEFLLDKSILHYRGGTNWDQQPEGFHSLKTSILNNFIKKILID